jgi:hypothetical protein
MAMPTAIATPLDRASTGESDCDDRTTARQLFCRRGVFSDMCMISNAFVAFSPRSPFFRRNTRSSNSGCVLSWNDRRRYALQHVGVVVYEAVCGGIVPSEQQRARRPTTGAQVPKRRRHVSGGFVKTIRAVRHGHHGLRARRGGHVSPRTTSSKVPRRNRSSPRRAFAAPRRAPSNGKDRLTLPQTASSETLAREALRL